MRRLLRCLLFVLLVLFVLVTSGLLLADHLTPQSMGQPGHALPVQPAQTAIDRALALDEPIGHDIADFDAERALLADYENAEVKAAIAAA